MEEEFPDPSFWGPVETLHIKRKRGVKMNTERSRRKLFTKLIKLGWHSKTSKLFTVWNRWASPEDYDFDKLPKKTIYSWHDISCRPFVTNATRERKW